MFIEQAFPGTKVLEETFLYNLLSDDELDIIVRNFTNEKIEFKLVAKSLLGACSKWIWTQVNSTLESLLCSQRLWILSIQHSYIQVRYLPQKCIVIFI